MLSSDAYRTGWGLLLFVPDLLAQLSDSELMGRLRDSLEKLGIDPQAFKLLLAEKRSVPESSKKGNGGGS